MLNVFLKRFSKDFLLKSSKFSSIIVLVYFSLCFINGLKTENKENSKKQSSKRSVQKEAERENPVKSKYKEIFGEEEIKQLKKENEVKVNNHGLTRNRKNWQCSIVKKERKLLSEVNNTTELKLSTVGEFSPDECQREGLYTLIVKNPFYLFSVFFLGAFINNKKLLKLGVL